MVAAKAKIIVETMPKVMVAKAMIVVIMVAWFQTMPKVIAKGLAKIMMAKEKIMAHTMAMSDS